MVQSEEADRTTSTKHVAAKGRTSLLSFVPGLEALLRYDRSNLSSDLLASLVVALVLIPSAIAYAELANCSAAAGLYAAIAGMAVYALFSSSRHVIVGPDAAIALLVGAAIGPAAGDDPSKAILLASVLSLLTAGALLSMAWLRLGIAADFLSSPALLGFINGASIVIIVSQLGKFCNIPLTESNTLLRFWEWCGQLPAVHWPTLVIGGICLAILAICRWLVPRVPGAVVVFVVALIAGVSYDFSQLGVPTIGAVDLRLPRGIRSWPTIAEVTPLFTSALGIALLVFSEGIVLGRTVARKHGYPIDADRELVAFGIANVAVGLLGTFAVGSSQTRTLLNDATGGRTQLVSFTAAALVIIFALLLMPLIATMPAVAIAAILIFSGLTLIDVHVYQQLWRQQHFSMVIAAMTTFGVIAIGVLPGILIGVVLALLGVLAALVRPHDALLGRLEGSETLHDIGDDDAAETIPGLLVYRFYGPLFFANVRFFVERVEWFISQETTPVRQLILDARAIPSIDVTAAEQLADFAKILDARGIELVVVKAHLPLRETVSSLGVALHNSRRFGQLSEAVAAFLAEEADD